MTPAINKAIQLLVAEVDRKDGDDRNLKRAARGLLRACWKSAKTHRTVRPQVPEFVRAIASMTPGGKDSQDDADTINSMRQRAKALTRGMK